MNPFQTYYYPAFVILCLVFKKFSLYLIFTHSFLLDYLCFMNIFIYSVVLVDLGKMFICILNTNIIFVCFIYLFLGQMDSCMISSEISLHYTPVTLVSPILLYNQYTIQFISFFIQHKFQKSNK